MIIVIDGTDGSGKQTQSKLLFDYLKRKKYNVKLQSFPNYKSESSILVKKYLNGDFGNISSLSPFQASVFFSIDRLCTMLEYKNFLSDNGILILDRYVSSNLLHQASKIESDFERQKFITELEHFEFDNLNLPKQDLTLFLDLKPEISKKLREKRQNLKAGTKQDIHENNFDYLKNCYNVGKEIAKAKKWQVIKCFENDNILSVEEINQKIVNIVNEFLKDKKIETN